MAFAYRHQNAYSTLEWKSFGRFHFYFRSATNRKFYVNRVFVWLNAGIDLHTPSDQTLFNASKTNDWVVEIRQTEENKLKNCLQLQICRVEMMEEALYFRWTKK